MRGKAGRVLCVRKAFLRLQSQFAALSLDHRKQLVKINCFYARRSLFFLSCFAYLFDENVFRLVVSYLIIASASERGAVVQLAAVANLNKFLRHRRRARAHSFETAPQAPKKKGSKEERTAPAQS
jgi:hypothetical protein